MQRFPFEFAQGRLSDSAFRGSAWNDTSKQIAHLVGHFKGKRLFEGHVRGEFC